MTFGEHLRDLRKAKGLALRQLAAAVGVGFAYLSRVETGHMTYGEYPSDGLIHRLAGALDADENTLLVLAEKIPEKIWRRVLQRPEAFKKLADLDDRKLDEVQRTLDTAGAEPVLIAPKLSILCGLICDSCVCRPAIELHRSMKHPIFGQESQLPKNMPQKRGLRAKPAQTNYAR